MVQINGENKKNETPPKGRKLAFVIDEKLAGQPRTVPFPGAGDLRWRPCVEPVLGDEGLYVPLATLKDEQGVSYGDAIALIQRKATRPGKGKVIYVWMRMAELVDTDRLLFALFRLAAEKRTKVP